MAARELPVLPLAASSASSSDALQPLEPFVLAPTQSHSGGRFGASGFSDLVEGGKKIEVKIPSPNLSRWRFF